MRIALGLSYDGSSFNGWQTQPNGLTIQDTLERALGSFLDQSVRVTCAGRTDAGVHALEQVVHLDTTKQRSKRSWIRGLNSLLPSSISVNWVLPVNSSFHARFDATNRHYIYVLHNHNVCSPFLVNKVGLVEHKLDHNAVQAAASYLLGEHDFSSFRSSQCQANSPVRTINKLRIINASPFLVMEFSANAFLHHMIRNIVGALVEVGLGRKQPIWVKNVLEERNRAISAPTFTGSGLYLAGVQYPNIVGCSESVTTRMYNLTGLKFLT